MNGPVVTALETAVYVIPTDEPEADGTLTWDKTTMPQLSKDRTLYPIFFIRFREKKYGQ